jgi:SNF2 family DNA or RNA helicase
VRAHELGLHEPQGSKLVELMRLVEELREEGHRALVFSQFTSFLDIIEAALGDRGVRLQRLDGSTPPKERERRIDAYERGDGDVFLLSLQAGGTGLNLTSADYVILVDPWWNPAVEDQAVGRAHRIGQTKPVTVYRLFCRGTLEEKILEMQVDKRELVATVMDNATTVPAVVSGDDLLRLLEG